jgi:aryl-alcohol dehydrogenase-like predicted oxidoreductase
MRYKLLGRSGLRVSELCLGALTFGTENGWGATKAESRAMFDTFASAGGNFIDTANIYTRGTSEEYLGEFIAGDRGRFVVSTKYSLSTRDGDPNFSGNHRKNMHQALEASLRRLKTDYVDVYWVHAWDFMTPVEEVMRALDDVVRAGKALYVGISDAPAWIVSSANMLASLRGWTPFVGLQIEYNLILRDAERDLLPMARAMDLGVTVWGSLAFGFLTGKFNKGAAQAVGESRVAQVGQSRAPALAGLDKTRLLTERNLAISEEVAKIAAEAGRSPAQVALNWVRQQGPEMIPIVGARNLDQLNDNLGCLEIELTQDQRARLDQISRIELGFPHDFLSFEGFQQLTYGGCLASIDNHRLQGA